MFSQWTFLKFDVGYSFFKKLSRVGKLMLREALTSGAFAHVMQNLTKMFQKS